MSSANPPLTDGSPEDPAAVYARQVQAFRAHAMVFVVSISCIVGVNLLVNLDAGTTGDWSAWWARWAFFGSGAGVAVHGMVVRLNRPPEPGA